MLCGGSYLQVKRVETGNIQFKWSVSRTKLHSDKHFSHIKSPLRCPLLTWNVLWSHMNVVFRINMNCRNCLYIFSTHQWHKHLDARCWRSAWEIMMSVLLCFAYNCKNTVSFNNHTAFSYFSFLSFTFKNIMVLYRYLTGHDTLIIRIFTLQCWAINSQLSTGIYIYTHTLFSFHIQKVF